MIMAAPGGYSLAAGGSKTLATVGILICYIKAGIGLITCMPLIYYGT